MSMKKKVVFFGTPEHAKVVLEKFSEHSEIELVGVVTNPDRPVGRKKVLTPSPVKAFAEEKNIPVLSPEKFSEEEGENAEKWLTEKNADFFIVVAYGVLVPQNIIDIPKNGMFNLHFSLLPKYRGASPVQSAILQNSEISGISVFRLVLEMDAGDIFFQEKIDISGKTFEESIVLMTEVGTEKCIELCTEFLEISGVPQDESLATFCGKFTKADGEISPEKNTASEIFQKFLAFHEWPGIFFFDENEKRVKLLEIKKAEISQEEISGKNNLGEFFLQEKKLFLQTQEGILEVLKIQKEGKKPVSGREYLS